MRYGFSLHQTKGLNFQNQTRNKEAVAILSRELCYMLTKQIRKKTLKASSKKKKCFNIVSYDIGSGV